MAQVEALHKNMVRHAKLLVALKEELERKIG